MSPSLVNWMTSMMTMRLQVILEHMPITEDQILHYVVHTPVTPAHYTTIYLVSMQHQRAFHDTTH